MSGYQNPPFDASTEDEQLRLGQDQSPLATQAWYSYAPFAASEQDPLYFAHPQQLYQPTPQSLQPYSFPADHQAAWAAFPAAASDYQPPPQTPIPHHPYRTLMVDHRRSLPVSSLASAPTGFLSPEEAQRTRPSRATSLTSNTSSAHSVAHSDILRSTSPHGSKVAEMTRWGNQNPDTTWSCAHPTCASKSTFTRACDIRKHFTRHTKTLFCRCEGCPQAVAGAGYSSKKDRARHEAKHNPDVVCEWCGCGRLFSRVDNMKDHVRRVHRRSLVH
ncbi:hypothetical protein LTR08_001656 [Meristemomyces frigidus]|nr:hypothetical protein LTR08_001656 [Meristemomyces frigidus]